MYLISSNRDHPSNSTHSSFSNHTKHTLLQIVITILRGNLANISSLPRRVQFLVTVILAQPFILHCERKTSDGGEIELK